MEKDVFRKYYSRLAREGWLKAFLCGLGIGLAVLFIAALVTWLFGFADVYLYCSFGLFGNLDPANEFY